MRIGRKQLLVVGDRVLVRPAEGEERTKVGLYLPPTAVEKESVQGGRIVEVGPGTPIPIPSDVSDEPWKKQEPRAQRIPMEARVGDYALFMRNASTEIVFEEERFLVVPQAAILLLIRESESAGGDLEDQLGDVLP
jgi:chaperonin GroES